MPFVSLLCRCSLQLGQAQDFYSSACSPLLSKFVHGLLGGWLAVSVNQLLLSWILCCTESCVEVESVLCDYGNNHEQRHRTTGLPFNGDTKRGVCTRCVFLTVKVSYNNEAPIQ